MYRIITFTGFIILFLLGVYLIYRSHGRRVTLIAGIWIFSASIWALGQTFLLNVTNNDNLLWSIGLAHLGVFMLSSTTIHFALIYPNRKKFMDYRFMPFIIYIGPIVFYLLFLTNKFHNLFYSSLFYKPETIVNYTRGFAIFGSLSLIMVYLFVFIGLILFSISTWKNRGRKKIGSLLLTLGILIGMISAIVGEIWLIVPGTLLFPISGILFSFAVLKYRIVDVAYATAAENVLDTIADCLIITDQDNNIKKINNSFKNIVGFDESFVVDKKIDIFFNTDGLKDLFNGGVIRNYQNFLFKKNGEKIYVLINASPLIDKYDTIVGFVYTFSDVTDQKKMEEKLKDRTLQVEKLLEQKNDFINLLAHDLKTPLTPLMTLLPLIKSKVKDEKMKELLDMNIKNAHTIKDLIDNALNLARLDDVEKNKDFKQISLEELIEEVIDINKDLLGENGFNVETNINEDLRVFGDSFQLKEVFNNLISNAIKFTPEDAKGRIIIDSELDDRFVKIAVSDNGKGLDKDEKSRVFNKFYKNGQAYRGMTSTGLGLSICKNIVEKHGGRIWVDSKGPGKGSTFYLTLKKIR